MNPAFETLTARLADPDLADRLSPERRPHGPSRAAVLLLLSAAEDPDLLFTERGRGLRNHAGQVSFPGGGRESGDADEVATALREAREEVGLSPRHVHVLGTLPATRLPVSRFDVAPVVGWWAGVEPLAITSPDEVAAIHRWRVSELADPAHRVTSQHPSGHRGPAWQFGDVFLWGFTAYLTDALLTLGGWARPWHRSRVVEVPARFLIDRQPR